MVQLKTFERTDQVMSLVWEEAKLSIEHDDKKVFLDAVKRQLGISKSGFSTCDLSQLWSLICRKKSTSCAAALLENDIGLDFDVNVELIDEMRPLHLAAENLSSPLVKLFLDHGAKTNLRTGDRRLPLSVALEKISCHYLVADWTPEISVWKLVYLLCLSDLVQPLEVATMLSGSAEEVQSVAKQCIEEGNVVQLAALLMVAREKLLESVSGNESDGSAIEQEIMKKLAQLLRLESQLIVWGHEDKIKSVEQHKNLMVSAMQLLAIFERAGGEIENYCSVSRKNARREDVAWKIYGILSDYGFCCEKHTNFNVTNLGPEEEEKFKKSLLAKMPSMTSLPGPIQLGSIQCPKQLLAMPLLQRLLDPCSQIQSIHTCARPNINSGFRVFAISGSQVNQSHDVINPLLSKFRTKRFSALASTIMRRIHF